jgi:hypothetical protein
MMVEKAIILHGGQDGGVRRLVHNVDHVAAQAEPPRPNRAGRIPNPESRIRP